MTSETRGIEQLYRRHCDERINLSSNELMHSSVTGLLKHAASKIRVEGLSRYPCYAYGAESIAAQLNTIPKRLLMVPGTDAAIRAIVSEHARATNGTGTVILQDPNYYAWEQAVASSKLNLIKVTWNDPKEQGRSLIEGALARSKALVALSFPNGPIGGSMTLEELDKLVELCSAREHKLVIDTCYSSFFRELPPLLNRWIEQPLIVQSLSKSYGLAGCRIGFLSGDVGSIRKLASERLEHAVSMPAIIMATQMLAQRPAMSAIWDDIASIRKECFQILKELGLQPIPSDGNFLTFCTGSADQAAGIAVAMSRQGYRIKTFESSRYRHCLRMTVAEAKIMQPALVALTRVV